MRKNGGARERPREVHGNVERSAALLDVRLLDVLAELESLLRSGREIQREALRIRGVPEKETDTRRAAAAERVEKISMTMARDHRALGGVLRALKRNATDLHRSV